MVKIIIFFKTGNITMPEEHSFFDVFLLILFVILLEPHEIQRKQLSHRNIDIEILVNDFCVRPVLLNPCATLFFKLIFFPSFL